MKFSELNWEDHPVAKEMKEFKETNPEQYSLIGDHMNMAEAKIATIKTDNGYLITVLDGECFYCKDGTYEVGVRDIETGEFVTPQNDGTKKDVRGYCFPEEVEQIIGEVQSW